jgi:hypothetical protein
MQGVNRIGSLSDDELKLIILKSDNFFLRHYLRVGTIIGTVKEHDSKINS